MSVTASEVEPMCYAISSSNTYLKNWTIDVMQGKGGQSQLMYSYRGGQFLKKPEDGLDQLIAQGQEQHDQNASDIVSAALNAMNNRR